MKSLFKYKDTIKDFIIYLNSKDYDTKKIITGDLTNGLGYVLEYLTTHGIYCLVDCYSCVVYCDGTHERSQDYILKTNTAYIIKEINNKNKKPIIVQYEHAIKHAFGFLEIPF